MAARASIGDYVVTSKLGSGSFAVVYKGYHKVTKVPVAIKAMSLTKLNAKLLANLEMEIAIMRQIDHPNVVKLYEIKKTEKHMYLMLEFCAGGDLQQYMRRQHQREQAASGNTAASSTATTTALSEDVARHFLKELAKGMKCLWTHNLIHRDLKPQNLLLTEDSPNAKLKIADFGFARHLATTSLAETLCGSPLYMAPEILKFQKYDAKADLWSVGTILYELVVGKPPYGGSNHVQLLANIERNDLKFPKDVTLSNECRTLLTGLLHRRPVNRMGFDEFFRDPFVGLAADLESGGRVGSEFQSMRMATSILEEEEEEEEKQEPAFSTSRRSETGTPASAAPVDQRHRSFQKERSASESQMDVGGGSGGSGSSDPSGMNAATYASSLRNSRSGNMEVMQNVFGNTSSNMAAGTGAFGSSAMRRSSRLGRSRRATSSGAILVNQNTNSPKLSPQMSPNVLPSPGPRINPFKELSESPPSNPGIADNLRSSTYSSQRASRTHATLVKQKNGNNALDSSGEYVIVDSGSEKGAPTPPASSSPREQNSQSRDNERISIGFDRESSSQGHLTTKTQSASPQMQAMAMDFSHDYAQKLVDIVNLRIQAIAPIAEQLWKMSALSASDQSLTTSGTNLASVFSLSSSTSSTSAQALAGISNSSVALTSESNIVVVEKKQYVFAAEALALYVKCMRMIQHALLYLRQDPALTSGGRASSGSNSSIDKTPVPWGEASRKVSMAFLVEQLNVFLDRADQCKRRMTAFVATSQAGNDLRSLVVSQDELLYTHALRLGKEGAVKEVLGQSRTAYELYLQAMLLLESLLMEAPASQGQSKTVQSTALTIDDQKRIASFVKALDERLKSVKQTMEKQQQAPSPPLLPRPMVTHSAFTTTGVTTSPMSQ